MFPSNLSYKMDNSTSIFVDLTSDIVTKLAVVTAKKNYWKFLRFFHRMS
jgi:hypothetical protein